MRERRRRDQDALSDKGVTAHELPLLLVERAGLVQDRFRDRDLADVVELAGELDAFQLVLVEFEALGRHLGELSNRSGMFTEAGVALVERLQEYVGALTRGGGAAGLALV